MASSCSTSLLDHSFSMKFCPYVPRAAKPRPKSKAKPMSTTKTAEHSRSRVDSSKDDGDWFHIDDFPVPDSNGSRSLDPREPGLLGAVDASSSLDLDVVDGLGAATESEKPEHYQSSWKSLDGGGTDHVTSVAKTDSTLNDLFDGSSLENPFILESDAAEEHHSTTQVKPSSGASDYHEKGYYATASTEGDHASMRALSVEGVEGLCHEAPSPAEDEPLFNFDVTSGSPLSRKRTRLSSVGMIISSAEVSDITSEPELEDPRSAKRQRPSERQAKSLILDHVPTPKPTPLPTPSGPDSRSRASNEASPSPPNNDSQGRGAGSLVPSSNNLDEGGARKSHEDGLGQVDEVSGKPSVKASQRSRRNDQLVQKRGRGLSRTTLRQPGWGKLPTRTSRNVTSAQPCQPSKSGMDSANWSCSPRTSSPRTEVGGGTNAKHGSSDDMAYQITDITHCYVPEGSSIVTAIVRYRDSSLSLDPVTLNHKLLGGESKIIRMTQLSPDSWMLLGYRYDAGTLEAPAHGSLTLLNADQMRSSHHRGAPSHDVDYSYDDGDEEDEDGEEYKPHANPHATDNDRGCRRDDTCCRQRKHKPWLESDEERLLSYKDKMGMNWNQITPRFPDRSEGAIKLRYYTLRKKDS